MIAQFSADYYPPLCFDPQGCRARAHSLALHMQRVRAHAEQDFTDFLGYDPHRIICLDEQVVRVIDHLGLSWRAVALSVREGYLLDWQDRASLLPASRTAQPPQWSPITLRIGRRAVRHACVLDLDEQIEYHATPGRYCLLLRCFPSAPDAAPLLVEATYERPPRGKTWALHIEAVARPAAEKWNSDYSQLLCSCAERTTSYEEFLFPSGHA